MSRQNLPWQEAILLVLKDAAEPLHYTEIAQTIIDNELRADVGATPAKSVAGVLSSSKISRRVEKTSRGYYRLRQRKKSTQTATGRTITEISPNLTDGEIDSEAEAIEERGLINAFGMFWQRDKVRWTSSPRILGEQQEGSTPVDFSNQAGVYILYDGVRVVYVGRAGEKRLGVRLREHTRDRLGARWDRFSWFGVRRVNDDGRLDELPGNDIGIDTLIATMEALLIEGLEPPQNRRRGDGFDAVEFIQAKDHELEEELHREYVMRTLLS